MKIVSTGIVKKVYKTNANSWCVEIKRTASGTKGITTYIGFERRPRVKEGQKVYENDYLY